MAPLDTSTAVTAWVPLTEIKARPVLLTFNAQSSDTHAWLQGGVSTLDFAVGSHRDFALPMWHNTANKDLTGRYELADTGKLHLAPLCCTALQDYLRYRDPLCRADAAWRRVLAPWLDAACSRASASNCSSKACSQRDHVCGWGSAAAKEGAERARARRGQRELQCMAA